MPNLRLLLNTPTASGVAAGLGAFFLWGLVFPVYIKFVSDIDPVEVVAHRVVWTVAMLGAALVILRGPSAILRAIGTWRRLGILALTAALVTCNWTVFIWAVMEGRMVEASLGYYINPLVNVLLGVVFLAERLNRRQTAAVGLAAVGVLCLIAWSGDLPWVSLVLPLTFGFYGMIRKRAAIDPTVGLLVETALILPVAGAYIAWVGASGSFGTVGIGTDIRLILAGPMTFAPLLLFLFAAQRLKYSTIGLMQYLGPSGQLALGILVYGEHFSPAHLVAFAFIWAALCVYSLDAWTHRAVTPAA